MRMNRRGFLQTLAIGGGALSAPSFANARQDKALSPGALGLLYDATKCVGCQACVIACKEVNGMPPEFSDPDHLWDAPLGLSASTRNVIALYKEGGRHSFVRQSCMHCVDPACVSACPVKALTKEPKTGVVHYDAGTCIGCRYCMVACPFNVPKFEWGSAYGKIVKCQLCDHLIAKGQKPGCSEACPTGAIQFGGVQKLLQEAHARLKASPGAYYPKVYGEKEGGGTQVIFLSALPFEKLGLPDLPDVSSATLSETIMHTTYKGFGMPIFLFALFAFLARRNLHKGKEE